MRAATARALPETPPGTLNTTTTQLISSCKVEFPSRQIYNVPLPPLNRVNLNDDHSGLGVSAFFLVDATLIDEHRDDILFSVYQLYCIGDTGEPQLQCYITANYTNGKSNEYYSVQVFFDITADYLKSIGLTAEDITSVQTFLWNIDPRTSRGTVTTVLPATA